MEKFGLLNFVVVELARVTEHSRLPMEITTRQGVVRSETEGSLDRGKYRLIILLFSSELSPKYAQVNLSANTVAATAFGMHEV